MKLRFTERATQDIADIAEYIRQNSPVSATRVRSAILETIENLVLFPRAGRMQSVEGVRKLITRRYGYFIYYAINERDENVVILTVQHPARERLFND